MHTPKIAFRAGIAALTVGASLGGVTLPAAAWPTPLTDVEIRFLDSARASFPAGDDQLLLMGKQMCRLLYTGSSAADAIAATAGPNGATPEQAGGVLNAARATMCTQAPG